MAYLRKSQIPPHVATVEFFEVARNRLTPDGLFVVNLTGSKEFLRRVSITMQVVFPGSTFWSVDSGRNEVAASSRQAGLIQRPQAAAQPRLEADLIKLGVDLPYLADSQHRDFAQLFALQGAKASFRSAKRNVSHEGP